MVIISTWSFISITAFASQIFANTLHEHMDVDGLRTLFHVEHHSEVPVYEVISLHSVVKRNADGAHKVRLKAFGEHHDLQLEPSDRLFTGDKLRAWTAHHNSTTDTVHYTELPNDEHIGVPYQDVDKRAAVVLHNDHEDGTILMEGTIGDHLVVKPVPAVYRRHVQSATPDDEMFLDQELRDGENEVSDQGFPLKSQKFVAHHKHVVYRRNPDTDRTAGDYALMEPDALPRSRRKRSITKREAPYAIYPEIMVIVDYDGYRLHGGDNVQIKRYFVSFWNGVDLRYRLLKGPKIRISIAGIIISRARDATPYLERNRVGRDAIDSAAALTDMGKYLFKERRLPVYDIAVAVTKYDMCRRRKGGRCTKGTAGFAYVGGACVVNKRLEKVNSVAIIEDTGGFSGIIVAAHEVGHLLGAVHDGSPPPTYLGGPGAEKCRWEDGYIMSDLRHTEKGFRWSPCSVSSFHHFLNGDTATCLFNSPHEDESLPRMLPGKLLTLDAQCRKDRGTSACFKDDRVCAQLFCFDAGSGYCVAYRPAAEGSPCGDGQHCTNGKCITEHENIIPDFSQNTPAYLRRLGDEGEATQDWPQYLTPNITTQRSVWNDYWRTTQKTIATTTNTNNNLQPRTQNLYIPNPYQQPPQITTTSGDTHDARLPTYKQLLLQQQQQQQQPQIKQLSLGNGDKNEDPLAALLKNKYYHSGPQELKTVDRPQSSSKSNGGGPYADECVDRAGAMDMLGAVSCYDYLSRYGMGHCSNPYIRENCCAAVKYVCNGGPSRQLQPLQQQFG
ncbi:A disintegrin and metalloproteinase with thrombospondin motifs 1 isoform X2 [Rhopalosiphum maidis]|uniref:A disintegrin and metalloproteinase with thrombospondin motifs 1 isoform X2 n=1 Tax=Rhopalosiphum maidis TaxID=43146 RepID=UPI000F00ED76|nr:A disintegrin and metalloproteinase with thrombospondin motifs 1 isoform X2 [Rhopalosiphum maidis]